MSWFARQRPWEIWDEPIQWPIGDIEAADRIRNICQSAMASAELVGGLAARAEMEIAMKISDDLMRDDAVRHIVDLCMKAGDTKTAQILYRAVQAVWIR